MKRQQRQREVTTFDLERIGHAIRSLMNARHELRSAGAFNAAIYVSRALKSAQGAQRHATGRIGRQSREEQS